MKISKNGELDEAESITQSSFSQKSSIHFRSLQAKMDYLKEQGKLKDGVDHRGEEQQLPPQEMKNEESTGSAGIRQG